MSTTQDFTITKLSGQSILPLPVTDPTHLDQIEASLQPLMALTLKLIEFQAYLLGQARIGADQVDVTELIQQHHRALDAAEDIVSTLSSLEFEENVLRPVAGGRERIVEVCNRMARGSR